MADMTNLFRKSNADRMRSPEKLDEYIKVSSPKAWILVIALSLVLVGAIVWGFVGSIAHTVTVKGVVYQEKDNLIICALPVDTAGQYLVGHEASFTLPNGETVVGSVVGVSEVPYSYEEFRENFKSDWKFYSIWGDTTQVYQYLIAIGYEGNEENSLHLEDLSITTATIVLSEMKPIQYLFN